MAATASRLISRSKIHYDPLRMRGMKTCSLRTLFAMATLLWAHVGTVLHVSALEHRYCEEHGRIEHDTSSPDRESSQGPSRHQDDHDGCDIVLLFPSGDCREPGSPSAVALDICEARLASECPEPPLPAIPLLRLSPKTSPPAAS
jgi:hypothetical protein